MDHHCGFTGNCIGFGNLKYFVLFLFYIALQCASGAFLILRYSIQNSLQDFIYVSPVKSFLQMQTYLLRKAIADAAENYSEMTNEQVNFIR
jgi:hypothetical protein